MTTYTGAILAGGAGSRMGQPKEGVLMPDGRPMIEHVIEPLSSLCQKIVILGACRGFDIPSHAKFISLPDAEEGRGPASAIATLLKSGIDKKGYVVCACDQPFLSANLLRLLVEETPSSFEGYNPLGSNQPRIFQSAKGEMLIPFPGYYPVDWLSEMEKGFEVGERSICALLKISVVSFVSLPNEWKPLLKNINLPSDLDSLL